MLDRTKSWSGQYDPKPVTPVRKLRKRIDDYGDDLFVVNFYIAQPDPVNVQRFKFGVSRDVATRFAEYAVICPQVKLCGLWQVGQSMERTIITLLTQGISTAVSSEVYDVLNPGRFWYRVKNMRFKRLDPAAELARSGVNIQIDTSKSYGGKPLQ